MVVTLHNPHAERDAQVVADGDEKRDVELLHEEPVGDTGIWRRARARERERE